MWFYYGLVGKYGKCAGRKTYGGVIWWHVNCRVDGIFGRWRGYGSM